MTDPKGPDDDCTTPTEMQPSLIRWSDEMAGCLCYYSAWYPPAIHICDCREDASDSESMTTVYSKSREVSRSPLHKTTPADSEPPVMPSKIRNAWGWWRRYMCCCRATDRQHV
jgi:hypothetical protein